MYIFIEVRKCFQHYFSFFYVPLNSYFFAISKEVNLDSIMIHNVNISNGRFPTVLFQQIVVSLLITSLKTIIETKYFMSNVVYICYVNILYFILLYNF